MAEIPADLGEGGRHLQKDNGNPRNLKSILDGIADDLAANQPTAIASPDATDLAEALTLVNEIKAELNTREALTVSTTKE